LWRIAVPDGTTGPSELIMFDQRVMAYRLDIRIVEIEIAHTPDLGALAICLQFFYIGQIEGLDRCYIFRIIAD